MREHERDGAVADLELWRRMLVKATELHAELPGPIRRQLDRTPMECELHALTVHMASLSGATLAAMARTVDALLAEAKESAKRAAGDSADVVELPLRQAL